MKAKTPLKVSCDFALAEAVTEYARAKGISREELLRRAVRAYIPDAKRLRPHEPLPWVQCDETPYTKAWMLDAGHDRWAVLRSTGGYYPRLTIEEPGRRSGFTISEVVPIREAHIEFALYLAESILLRRWPDLGSSGESGSGLWGADLSLILVAA